MGKAALFSTMGCSSKMLRALLASSAFLLASCRPNQANDVDLNAASDGVSRRLRGRHGPHDYFDPSTVEFKAQVQAARLFPVDDAGANPQYVPSECERYIVEHAEQLGFASEDDPRTCHIWMDPDATGDECDLDDYSLRLEAYNAAVADFEPIPDIFPYIQRGDYGACAFTRLNADGLGAFFRDTQLSLSSAGYTEPLLPPMRSAKFCYKRSAIMDMDYFVHDFEAMCRKLKPTSRRVLIDMGASLSFHGRGATPPIVSLLTLYEKFGFHFDHIFGFEITFTEPQDVYEKFLPEKYLAKYHWINAGVTAEEGHRLNPLHSILKQFNEDDFIVVKLDIDTSSIEVPLSHQILDGGEGGIYHRLIDQFYYEHHVHIKEIRAWTVYGQAQGTIKDSLELFYGLRERGVPAHFWP